MTTAEKFAMEGNDKTNELAKNGADVDGETRAARQLNMRRISMPKLRKGRTGMNETLTGVRTWAENSIA